MQTERAASGARARRRRRVIAVRSKRVVLLSSGSTLVVAGVATIPTPVPIGLLLIVLGLYFLARGSKTSRRAIPALRRRMPFFSRSLNVIGHRLPKPLRQFIERSDPGV
ncbi:PGPGW domain-containing protein [Telmatospirillum sp. J64-1]|uniref:PGPGW domain-containing protein n=1 Tax=Telmatospirillum sp. J64-1 TaxID=2502183 RepID=UPI00115CCF44|nr:PGPGW domain-containing protein [Telmatospirillum sp. J64-1]